MDKIVEKVWDYSKNAEFYNKYRPNYSPKAIDMLMNYVGAKVNDSTYSVADIGAGTGNLTILLLNSGLKNVTAVEPNDEMRKIGEQVTRDKAKWVRATATETTLSEKYDWVTFGSSFNVIDRKLALKETSRILKDGGFFTCMWNHRDLECPIQKAAEKIVESIVPNYERGVRREDQRPFLEKNANEFKNICYVEVDFSVQRTIDEYILAWKSVKNKYWDLETEEGGTIFTKIVNKMRKELPETFEVRYTTRAWTMQKRLQVLRGGDFSALAKNYINRPAYDTELIKKIMEHMGAVISDIAIADVGAGTGKLTKVLATMGAHDISAVEPNDEMRREGEVYTKEFSQIHWSKGTGENTGLPDNCVDLVTMASSFHWTDPNKSLPEFSRILKKGGYLSIMWNTRDVASSKLHTEIENIIYEIAPDIKRVSSGNASHTKNWEEVLVSTGHFKDVKFIETSYVEHMTKERYMGAWRSVNDIRAQAGEKNFNLILEKIEQSLKGMDSIDVPYKMRSWTVKKV